MILIYTPSVKPRIKYIFKHFFSTRMGEEVGFTSELSVFIAHSGPKMSYGETPLGNEFFIAAQGLLTSQGVNSLEVNVFDWDGIPAFFATHTKSELPFDIFSASFYLLSRYEEYLPFVSDDLGRYKSNQSLAYLNDFLHIPLVDMWFDRFAKIWRVFFELETPQIETNNTLFLVVDVPELYSFRYKSFLRNIFEGIQDVFRFKISHVFDRVLVVLGFRSDPLEGLLPWIEAQQNEELPIHFFVLYTTLGIHDRSLSVFSGVHQRVIKSISDYVPTAPLASFESSVNPPVLSSDIERFKTLIHRPVKAIRQHKLALRFPNTYRTFSEQGIRNDYSMQYPDRPGFRASTAFPFRFYDLGDEQQTPLTIHPVCLSEYHIRDQRFSRKMRQLFLTFQECLSGLNAPFIVAISNKSFNSRSKNATYLTTLNKLLTHE